MFSSMIRSFHEGGTMMYGILALGIAASGIVLERFFSLHYRFAINKEHMFKNLRGYLFRGDFKGMILVCDQNSTPMAKVVKGCLLRLVNNGTDADIQAALDEGAMMETPAIERRIGFLAVIANVSTLVGLLGTVTGLITAFKGVANADPATKAAMLTKGIGEAMNTTAFGLMVAIPAMIAYAVLQSKAQRLIDDINEISIRTLNFILANRERFGVQEAA